MPLDKVFFTRRDGLEPEEVYSWLQPLLNISPLALSMVSMPVWLADAIGRTTIPSTRRNSCGIPSGLGSSSNPC
jgi:hypothetical protein